MDKQSTNSSISIKKIIAMLEKHEKEMVKLSLID
jgi:hypothetical protein